MAYAKHRMLGTAKSITILQKISLKKETSNLNLYFSIVNGWYTVILMYVDDLLVTCES